MTTSISVFLADDHAVVRDGLRLLLGIHGDIEVVGDAANGRRPSPRSPRCAGYRDPRHRSPS